MRKFLKSLVAFLVAIGSMGIHRVQLVQAAAIQLAANSATAVVKLNLNSPLGLDTQLPKPDFTAEFVIPARQKLLEQEQKKRAAKVAAIAEALRKAGLSADFADQYVAAEAATGTPWQLIAAVHKIESGQRGDTTVASYAGAQGPMQFMPPTWRAYALDGDGDGVASIHDVDDAILTGANYLRAGGAAQGNFYKALFNYNHADWYVQKVLGVARTIGLPA